MTAATDTTKLTDLGICQELMKPGATLASVGKMIDLSEAEMSRRRYKNFALLVCDLQADKERLQSQVSNLQATEKNLQTDKKNLQSQLANLQTDKKNLQSQAADLQATEKNLQAQVSNLQSVETNLQVSNDNLQSDNKKLQIQLANLQSVEKNLQVSNDNLQIIQDELEKTKKELTILRSDSEQAIIPKYLYRSLYRYLGDITTGNVVVSIVNIIECCSLFSCSVYIMPTLVLGIICGIMLSSVLWYAQSIIKSPRYISVSKQFMTVSFFVMCLSMSAHYAAISKNGGVFIASLDVDITWLVSIVIPAISFASLYLRQAQAQLEN